NSFNVLLLNYAGYQTNLTANTITLGSNTMMTILASVVNVTNTANSNYLFEIGGTVNHGAFPAVKLGVLRSGDIGPGAYSLANGALVVAPGYVGGAFTSQFNQFGGYNAVSALNILGPSNPFGQGGTGEYALYAGSLGGAVALENGGL